MSAKPSSRIVCIGADGSGKTTLAAVLSFLCAGRWGGVSLSPGKIKAQHNITKKSQPPYSIVQYQTEARAFTHIDYLDHQALLEGLFIEVPGSMDGVIWLVNFSGLSQQDLQQVKLLKALSLPPTLVFLNQAFGEEYDTSEVDELEISARTMLAENDFAADEIPVIRGQALLPKQPTQEHIEPLLRLLDTLEQRVDLQRPPPYFVSSAVSRKIVPEDAPIIFTGYPERGKFKVGEIVELVGFEAQTTTKIVEIEEAPSQYHGDWLRFHLEKIDYSQGNPGQIISTPGAFSLVKKATVLVQDESLRAPQQEIFEWASFGYALDGICFMHQLYLYWSRDNFSLKNNIGTIKTKVKFKIGASLDELPNIFRARLEFPSPIALCLGGRLLLDLNELGRFSVVVINMEHA